MNDFARGFFYLLQGFQLIREKPLVKFIWVPLLCNILLFLTMLFFAGQALNHFSHWVDSFLPDWLHWLRWLVLILSLLVSALVLVFISTFVVNLVAGPFNSILSEKVITFLQVPVQAQNLTLMQTIPASIWRQIRYVSFYLPRAIFYLLLFLIPVVQVFAAFLWFLFNAWVFAMQYLDYPMDNHGVNFNAMREKMRQKRWVCSGFGAGVVLFSMIPLVNFIIIPVAVVGATVLWIKEFNPPVEPRSLNTQ